MGCGYCDSCGKFSDPGTKDVWRIEHGCFHDDQRATAYRTTSCMRFNFKRLAAAVAGFFGELDDAAGKGIAALEGGECEYIDNCYAAEDLPRGETASRGCLIPGEDGEVHRKEHCVHYRSAKIGDLLKEALAASGDA